MVELLLGELIRAAKPERAGERNFPLLSMTMHSGLVDQADRFKKRIASQDVSDYKVVKRGQLVVGFPIDEGVLDFQENYPAAIVSPAYGIWDVDDNSRVDRRYLKFALRSESALSYYRSRLRGSTARRRSLPSDVFLNFPLRLPNLEEQRRIVYLLGAANGVRMNRRLLIAELRGVARAIFDGRFGNLVTTATLGDLADVTSGVTKGRKTSEPTSAVPYLAVSNVQAGRLRLDDVKLIEATSAEIARYKLLEGDLLLTEGGDPDKLGRGALWRSELPLAIHQNHIFRARITDISRVQPEFLETYLGSARARAYFLRAAKQTTGIATINKGQLRALPIPLPPLAAQNDFRRDAAKVTKPLAAAELALAADDDLIASLQSRAFSGKL